MEIVCRITELSVVPSTSSEEPAPLVRERRDGETEESFAAARERIVRPRQVCFRCDRVLVVNGRETALGEPHRGSVEVTPDREDAAETMEAFLAREVAIASDGTTMSVGDILAQAGVRLG